MRDPPFGKDGVAGRFWTLLSSGQQSSRRALSSLPNAARSPSILRRMGCCSAGIAYATHPRRACISFRRRQHLTVLIHGDRSSMSGATALARAPGNRFPLPLLSNGAIRSAQLDLSARCVAPVTPIRHTRSSLGVSTNGSFIQATAPPSPTAPSKWSLVPPRHQLTTFSMAIARAATNSSAS